MSIEREEQTVLVVDDEPMIADTLAAILRHHGFNATAVYSGDAAVESARELPPYALVCDIVLSGVSGIEVATQVQVIRSDCKVILISGAQASSDLLDEGRANGHEFEVLAKPFHPTTLIEKLRAASDQIIEAA